MDRTENHLNYNPWLRGIYDEAKNIAASDPGTVLEGGLSELDLNNRAETIRRGDYNCNDYDYYHSPKEYLPEHLINHEAAAIPEAYFAFLFLIGGFSCRSVHLFNLGPKYITNGHGMKFGIASVIGPCVREKVITGETSSYGKTYEKSYPIQLILGRCDHGEYVYDRRYDSYSLIGVDQTTYFNNCEEMLNHAMYRARKNIEENWTAPEKKAPGAMK